MKRDIVYILREDIDPEELRYSLRSVVKNFPHGKVWFVGGDPKVLIPDVALYHKQEGFDKWDRIRNSLWKAIHDERLSEEFYLFNDDFFVMKKFKGEFVNYTEKTLTWRVEQIMKEIHPWGNGYSRSVWKVAQELKCLGKKETNFELHVPMLMEKERAKASVYKVGASQMRSIYGNLNDDLPTIERDDVKVYELDEVPEDADFISTSDKTFSEGAVGEFIRKTFPTPTRYEIDPQV